MMIFLCLWLGLFSRGYGASDLVSPLSPAFPVIANPIKQCSFKTYVLAQAFGFQPLVFQYLFSLSQEILI